MNVLTINCGSSSLKAHLCDVDVGSLSIVTGGAVERIGADASIRVQGPGRPPDHSSIVISDHRTALRALLDALGVERRSVEAIGHRVVQGGAYTQPAIINDAVIRSIDAGRRLAPLHNGPSLDGILAAGEDLPGIPMVAVFDTAFHATMPKVASQYALPRQVTLKYGLWRHGYHGIAHRAMVERYAQLNDKAVEDVTLVSLQLGNGCSATAVLNGRSVDTSMGFTPLEGLVMGTRPGDIDAGAITYLLREAAWSADDIEQLLNREAGLLGVSGSSADMATLLEEEAQGRPHANEAIEMFCYRARKYIGAYLAVLGRADAILFGGGIGERSPEVRRRICEPLEPLGLHIDHGRNAALTESEGPFHSAGSPIAAWVVPTDEERVIARDTFDCLTGGRQN